MATSRSYHFYLIESLKNAQEAAAYLKAVLEEGDDEQLRLALNNIAEAEIDDEAFSEGMGELLSRDRNTQRYPANMSSEEIGRIIQAKIHPNTPKE